MMTPIEAAHAVVFQKLHIENSTFHERMLGQKKIYLLKTLGTDLGYTYIWYLHGPHSPHLEDYLYTNYKRIILEDSAVYRLTDTAEQNIAIINSLIDDKPDDLNIYEWYQLLAALVYINQNRNSFKINDSDTALFSSFIHELPRFTTDHCRHAFTVLQNKYFQQEF